MDLVLGTMFLLALISWWIKDHRERRHVERVTLVALCLQCVVFLYVFLQVQPGIKDIFGMTFSLSRSNILVMLMYALVAMIIFWFSHYGLSKNETINVYINFYRYYLLILVMMQLVIVSDHLIPLSMSFIMGLYFSKRLLTSKHDQLSDQFRKKYVYMNFAGIIFVMLGLVILGALSGSLTLSGMKGLDMEAVQIANWVKFALGLATVGLGINGGLFPFYFWVTEMYKKSWAPIVAFSSSITITMPAILMLRLFRDGLGLAVVRQSNILPVILFLGCTNLVFGSLIANHQKHIKLLLSYHTIAQLGLIYIGIGLGTEMGMTISIFQILVHGLVSCSLYLSTEAIIEQAETVQLNELKGIGHEMPISLGVFAVSGLSMIGLPILPGFFARWFLLQGLIEGEQLLVLGIMMLFTLLTARSILPIMINGFFGIENIKHRVYRSKLKPLAEVLPLMVVCIIILALGYFSSDVMGVIW